MRLRWIALLSTLILLRLPAAACANGTDFSFAVARGGLSFSTSIARRPAGTSAHLIEAVTAGSSATEPSTGLLLLIGLGLIGGASLLGLKIRHCASAEEAENTGETATLQRPAWTGHEQRTPSITRMSTKAKGRAAAMEPKQIQQLGAGAEQLRQGTEDSRRPLFLSLATNKDV